MFVDNAINAHSHGTIVCKTQKVNTITLCANLTATPSNLAISVMAEVMYHLILTGLS